jgi:hypothetical protein
MIYQAAVIGWIYKTEGDSMSQEVEQHIWIVKGRGGGGCSTDENQK